MTSCGRTEPGPGRPEAEDGDQQHHKQHHRPLVTALWSWLAGGSAGVNCLRGKRALVSGSGGGLGRELSLQLVRQGCRVICIDQDALQVQETLGLARSLEADGVLEAGRLVRGFACDWRNPGEALGLSRAVTTTEGGVDLIFVVPESNNNNESAVDSAGKVIGNEFWPLLGFLPGMLARARGHVVHVLDEQIAHKTGLVADAWVDSLLEVGADVRYTKVHLHSDQARHRPCRSEDAAAAIVSAVRSGSTELHISYPVC